MCEVVKVSLDSESKISILATGMAGIGAQPTSRASMPNYRCAPKAAVRAIAAKPLGSIQTRP
jgi:hypothetical protein